MPSPLHQIYEEKQMRRRTRLLILLFTAYSGLLQAQTIISGTVTDKTASEPLPGVYVMVSGTGTGSVTDNSGFYELPLNEGVYTLEFRYISYKTAVTGPVVVSGEPGAIKVDMQLQSEELSVGEVYIIARRDLETEKSLLTERRLSSAAVENIGAREMSRKGISSVAEGVKKIAGISLAETGQLFVRGLGDRYSSTTLNGLPVASPNPDNKLIPLDLFPSRLIRNITVNKVYNVSAYADYSGAHIDIGLKEHTGDDFFSLNIGTGGNSRALFSGFFESDKKNEIFFTRNLPLNVKDMTSNEFSSYIKNHDPFGTSFSVTKRTLWPGINGAIGFGKSWEKGQNRLGMLVSLSVDYDNEIQKDAYISTINAQGTVLNEFNYNSYSTNSDMAGLMHLAYDLGSFHHFSYTFLYARNAVDNYKRREGYDSEGIHLIGSNSVFHAYSLLNNQLAYGYSAGDRWTLNVNLSYGITGSYEPDRRQVMYREDDRKLSLFKLNRQETMRYFGELEEREAVAELYAVYKMGEKGSIRFGASYKNKLRNYSSVRFYYNLNNLNPEITDIYETDFWLNTANIADGTIQIIKDAQPKSHYYAGHRMGGIYAQTDFLLFRNFNVNLGLRYEPSAQWVRYWNDASVEKRSVLSGHDLFPALNLKYSFHEKHSARFALSRTVTRPLFVEMAPFLYKESYGSAELRGNEALQNGYNNNADLRYEYYGTQDNLFSAALYYKWLENPIERVQESSGGSAVHSFRNAEEGMAAGVEAEIRKTIVPGLRIGLNASYMYTNVILPEGGGVYTDSRRALQGASPYLLNADIMYQWKTGKEDQVTCTMLYNLQGPRIHAVGIYGMGNIMQQPFHTLDFVSSYQAGNRWNLRLSVKNILDSKVLFTQQVKTTGEVVTVESYRAGVSLQIGFTYTL